MPYQWTQTAPDDSGAVLQKLTLWPHRSLPRKGFVWFIATTAILLSLPIVAMLGSPILWGLLPFGAIVVAGIWFALQHSYRTGQTHEELTLNRQRLHVRRLDPGKAPRDWDTNSYWVRAQIRKGPVQDYLTLTDGSREIELGVFLTPPERRALCEELTRAIARARG